MTIIECTAANPWPKVKHSDKQLVRHHNAEEVGEQRDGYPGGDLVTMRCPNCGMTWEMELPQ